MVSWPGFTGLAFGIYDIERVAAAPWFGLPQLSAYPGLDLTFGSAFWALLPGFLIVTLVGAMDTLGDAIAIQRASWREPRAIDFRSIQGAINADGLGNLLSGIGGTVPNTTYGSGIAISELTGITARSVGVCAGILFVGLALMPKLVALIVAMPGPVAGSYLAVIVAPLFVFGVKILTADGLDYRKSLIVGFAFWVGLAFQFDLMFPQLLTGAWGELLGHGMTAGGITMILLSGFLDLTAARPKRLRTALSATTLAEIDGFLCRFASKARCDEAMTSRLRAVAEETVHTLLANSASDTDRGPFAGGESRRQRRRPRVHRQRHRSQHRGPTGHAERRRDETPQRVGNAPASAAPLRNVGAPPAIPRHRDRHGSS